MPQSVRHTEKLPGQRWLRSSSVSSGRYVAVPMIGLMIEAYCATSEKNKKLPLLKRGGDFNKRRRCRQSIKRLKDIWLKNGGSPAAPRRQPMPYPTRKLFWWSGCHFFALVGQRDQESTSGPVGKIAVGATSNGASGSGVLEQLRNAIPDGRGNVESRTQERRFGVFFRQTFPDPDRYTDPTAVHSCKRS
jgi:hypothetical protein